VLATNRRGCRVVRLGSARQGPPYFTPVCVFSGPDAGKCAPAGWNVMKVRRDGASRKAGKQAATFERQPASPCRRQPSRRSMCPQRDKRVGGVMLQITARTIHADHIRSVRDRQNYSMPGQTVARRLFTTEMDTLGWAPERDVDPGMRCARSLSDVSAWYTETYRVDGT